MRSTRASLEADATPLAEVAPDGGAVRASLEADATPLAEVAPDGGAVRASLEADATPLAEVAPDGGAVRASLEADAAGVDPPTQSAQGAGSRDPSPGRPSWSGGVPVRRPWHGSV
ncbi:hypothetical protein [Tessaracoccus lapidicaptus]|uniref:hypothetical protein n=1 Tax=Tessaracoccus lapidicaptus TaxID=1427523 RepID=UPI000AD3C98B|nr:hypothetical protein [Tessaracoccus lapidicaptus]